MPEPRFTFKIEQRPRSPNWQARIYLAGEGGRERRWSTGIRIGRGVERRQSARLAERAAERHAENLAADAARAPVAENEAALGRVALRMLAAKRANGIRERAADALAFSLDRYVFPFLGASRDVTTIRRSDLEALKAKLNEQQRAPSTINNALTSIRQVLKFACLVEERMESVPTVENVRVDPDGKGRAFTVEQLVAWAAKVGTVPRVEGPLPKYENGVRRQQASEADRVEARHLVELIANTGIRREEALSLRFAWIDWTAGLINVPSEATKGGRGRPPVVINEVVERVLRERLQLHGQRRDPKDDRVFRRNRRMTREATRGAELAQLGPARLHDLRHTLGSLHVAAGATLTEVRDTLGHRTLAMVNRYQHSYIEQRRSVSEQVVIGKGVLRASAPGAEGIRGEIRRDHAKRGVAGKWPRAVGSP